MVDTTNSSALRAREGRGFIRRASCQGSSGRAMQAALDKQPREIPPPFSFVEKMMIAGLGLYHNGFSRATRVIEAAGGKKTPRLSS